MPSADFSRQTLFRPNPFSLGHRLLILKLLGISSARSLGVRHTSFTAQPPDLPSWRYVCLLGFGLYCNLTRHLALYQVSVRRLDSFATPLPSPQPHGFRLAVRYTWRQIPVIGLSPTRCAPCPTHNKTHPAKYEDGFILQIFKREMSFSISNTPKHRHIRQEQHHSPITYWFSQYCLDHG